jgi:hypothetical protein
MICGSCKWSDDIILLCGIGYWLFMSLNNPSFKIHLRLAMIRQW